MRWGSYGAVDDSTGTGGGSGDRGTHECRGCRQLMVEVQVMVMVEVVGEVRVILAAHGGCDNHPTSFMDFWKRLWQERG